LTSILLTCTQGGSSPGPELAALWSAADGMRAAIVGLLGDGMDGSPAAPDGVRLQAVRFAEQAALLCTAAAKPPPPPGAASLAGGQVRQAGGPSPAGLLHAPARMPTCGCDAAVQPLHPQCKR
jgi:hypothetical protein